MIPAINNNSILSALFGPGLVRGPRASSGQANHREVDALGNQESSDQVQSIDIVEISEAGKSAATNSPTTDGNSKSSLTNQEELSQEEKQQVQELKKRDQEVRRHEQAHKAAAGQYATGGASFEYETGPDGKRYAVGGEVSISTSEIPNNPQATIQKMQQIRRAALAPGHPSGQDRSVAAQAQAAERAAKTELAQQRREEMAETGQSTSVTNTQSSQAPTSSDNIRSGKTGGANVHVVTGSQSNIGIAGGDLLDVIA